MRASFIVVVVAVLLIGCSRSTPEGDAAAPKPPAATATAASSAAPNAAGEMITFPGKAGQASGFLALPKGGAGAKHPGLIVIQEWWGLDDWIKQNARRFADQGYVALAVDLYRGKATSDPSVAHELMRGLPEDRAAADLVAAFDALAARPDVDPARIGAIGWCMGGGYALTLATVEPRLRAIVMNYGRLVTDKGTIAKINAALLGNFAGEDQGIAPADVRAFEGTMRDLKKSADIKIYDGKGHAFMNPHNAKGYDEGASRDAWARIDAFFAKQLKGS